MLRFPPSTPLSPQVMLIRKNIGLTEEPTTIDQIAEPQGTPPNFVETQGSNEDNPLLTVPENFIFPLSTIQIFNPGDLSRVTSPFKVVAEIPKSMENIAIVELFGEDCRLIDQEVFYSF